MGKGGWVTINGDPLLVSYEGALLRLRLCRRELLRQLLSSSYAQVELKFSSANSASSIDTGHCQQNATEGSRAEYKLRDG